MKSVSEILINILTKGDPEGAEAIGKALDETATKADKLGKELTLKVTAPITAMAGAAVFLQASFDTAFREVSTLIDGPQESLAALRQDIRDLANDLDVDLVDSTKAAYNALSAGVPQDNLISFLEEAAKTGIAGVASTNESVELLTGLMNTYGISFDRAEEVSDKLFNTVKNGVTTIPKLASSLGQVAPMASAAGVELDDLLGAMATITKQTGNTAQASTGLAAAITSLLNPTESLQGIYKTLNVEGGRQLIAQYGLAGALQKVKEHTGDSDQAFIKAVGSTEAYRAAVNLTGENAKKAAADLASMAQSAGAANEAFEKMDGGPKRGMESAKAAAVEFANVVGDRLEPAVISVSDSIEAFFNSASKLNPVLLDIALAGGGIAAATGPILTATAAVIKYRVALQAAASVAGPWMLMLGAMAVAYQGIARAGQEAIDANQKFRDSVVLGDTSFVDAILGADSGAALDVSIRRAKVKLDALLGSIEDQKKQIANQSGFLAGGIFGAKVKKGLEDELKLMEAQAETYQRAIEIGKARGDQIVAQNAALTPVVAKEIEITEELTAQEKLKHKINGLDDDQKATRAEILAGMRRERALLDARISGDEKAVTAAENEIEKAQIIADLKSKGLFTDEEIAFYAETRIKLGEQAEATEKRIAEAKLNNLAITRDQVRAEDEAARLKAGVRVDDSFVNAGGDREKRFFQNGQQISEADAYENQGSAGASRTAPAAPTAQTPQSTPQLTAPPLDHSGVQSQIERLWSEQQAQIDDLASQLEQLRN